MLLKSPPRCRPHAHISASTRCPNGGLSLQPPRVQGVEKVLGGGRGSKAVPSRVLCPSQPGLILLRGLWLHSRVAEPQESQALSSTPWLLTWKKRGQCAHSGRAPVSPTPITRSARHVQRTDGSRRLPEPEQAVPVPGTACPGSVAGAAGPASSRGHKRGTSSRIPLWGTWLGLAPEEEGGGWWRSSECPLGPRRGLPEAAQSPECLS